MRVMKKAVLLSAASQLFAFVPAGAQTAPNASMPDQPSEIIVTATKRPERIQDVPFAITVVDAETLSARGEVRLQDYSSRVPGLQVADQSGGGAQTAVFMRGLSGAGAGNPTAAIYIDDTPLNASTFFGQGVTIPDLDPGDLARIEVLKGPQGTLYGATSMGGLIKYITRTPSPDSFSGQIQAGLLAVDQGELAYSIRGRVNVPLSEQMAVTVSGFKRRDPGFINNVRNGRDDFNSGDNFGGRAALSYKVNDDVNVNFSVLHQNQKLNGFPTKSIDGASGAPLNGDLERDLIPGADRFHSKMTVATGKVEGSFEGITLTSTSSYIWRNFSGVLDYTPALGSTIEAVLGIQDPGPEILSRISNRKFVQEFRASSSNDGLFNFQVGAFYTHEKSNFVQELDVVNGRTGQPLPTTLPVLLFASSASTYEEIAGFGTVTLKFSPKFDIEGGLRYSHNKQAVDQASDGIFVGGATRTPGSTSANKLTYSINPRYHITPDIMLYGRIATGFRPGGANVGQLGPRASYGPDSVTNYEIGTKQELLDRRLSLDIAAFYIDWDRIQLAGADPLTGLSYYRNAGRARSKGVEAAVVLTPVKGLTIDGNVAYTDAYLRDAFLFGGTYAPGGSQLPFSSKWAYHAGIDYSRDLSESMKGHVGASFRHLGRRLSFFEPSAATPRIVLPAFDTVDFMLGLETRRFDVDFFIRNAFDQRGVTGGTTLGSVQNLTLIQPRTVGVNVTARF